MIFARRRGRGPDPYLEWKVRLFFLAAIMAFAGIAVESSVFVGLAILVLLGGIAFRFLPGRGREGHTGAGGDPGAGVEERDADEGETPS